MKDQKAGAIAQPAAPSVNAPFTDDSQTGQTSRSGMLVVVGMLLLPVLIRVLFY